MFSAILLLFLPCTMGLLNSYSGVAKLLRCADEYRSPCRVKISIHYFNNTSVKVEENSELCACSRDRRCHNSWSTADSVQSVHLHSETSITQYSMMFCHKWRNRMVPRCKRNDTALQIAGFQDIPTNFVFFQCRCRIGTPLMLVARERSAKNLVYEKYTCSNFMTKCHPGQTCASRNMNQTSYHCKCPDKCHGPKEPGQSFCQ